MDMELLPLSWSAGLLRPARQREKAQEGKKDKELPGLWTAGADQAHVQARAIFFARRFKSSLKHLH